MAIINTKKILSKEEYEHLSYIKSALEDTDICKRIVCPEDIEGGCENCPFGKAGKTIGESVKILDLILERLDKEEE